MTVITGKSMLGVSSCLSWVAAKTPKIRMATVISTVTDDRRTASRVKNESMPGVLSQDEREVPLNRVSPVIAPVVFVSTLYRLGCHVLNVLLNKDLVRQGNTSSCFWQRSAYAIEEDSDDCLG